jgi:hypothetical protein
LIEGIIAVYQSLEKLLEDNGGGGGGWLASREGTSGTIYVGLLGVAKDGKNLPTHKPARYRGPRPPRSAGWTGRRFATG